MFSKFLWLSKTNKQYIFCAVYDNLMVWNLDVSHWSINKKMNIDLTDFHLSDRLNFMELINLKSWIESRFCSKKTVFNLKKNQNENIFFKLIKDLTFLNSKTFRETLWLMIYEISIFWESSKKHCLFCANKCTGIHINANSYFSLYSLYSRGNEIHWFLYSNFISHFFLFIYMIEGVFKSSKK